MVGYCVQVDSSYFLTLKCTYRIASCKGNVAWLLFIERMVFSNS